MLVFVYLFFIGVDMNIPLLCFMLQFVVLINIEVIRDIKSRGKQVSRTKAITLVSDQINTGPGPLNCSFLVWSPSAWC